MARPLSTVAVTALLVLSLVAGAGGAATASAAPGGFVGVPGANVGPPQHANAPDRVGTLASGPPTEIGPPGDLPTSAAAWDVLADRHAGSLTVEVGTVDGRLALSLSDLEHHAGREVAVSAETLEEAVGYRPTTAYGVHESGERWTAPIRYEDGSAIFAVPHFSTNTVTFDSTVEITGSPATDGTTYSYDLADLDAASAPNVTFTGRTAAEWDNVSAAGVANGGTVTLAIAGDLAPTGPSANGEPTVTFTGDGFERADSASAAGLDMGDSMPIGVDGNMEPIDGSLTVTGHTNTYIEGPTSSTGSWQYAAKGDGTMETSFVGPPETVNAIRLPSTSIESGTGGTATVSVYVEVGEQEDLTDRDGTLVADSVSIPTDGTTIEIPFSQTIDTNGQDISVAVVGEGGTTNGVFSYMQGSDVGTGFYNVDGNHWQRDMGWTLVSEVGNVTVSNGTSSTSYTLSDGQTATKAFDVTQSMSSVSVSGEGGTVDLDLSWTERKYSKSPEIDVDGDGVADASAATLAPGATSTSELAGLSTADDSATVSVGGTVDVAVRFRERAQTADPAIDVNGNALAYTGTLAEGSTVNLTGNETWLQEGTNTVNVTVGDGTLSTDAPTPVVGLDYSHSAASAQSVSYQAEVWSERYNVSKTFASDRSAASTTIQFGDDVVAVASVEKRKNGGSWQDVGTVDYSLEGTTMTVDLGSVAANDTVEVRTTGRKVKVLDGSIEVEEPTVAGDDLYSRIRIVTAGSNFRIELGSVDRIHHLEDASWSEEAYVVAAPDQQTLYMPGANGGSRTWVRTAPLDVTPDAGSAEVRVLDPSTPRFSVANATTDSLSVAYYNTGLEGEAVRLVDATNGDEEVVADTVEDGTATFLIDGSSLTYFIEEKPARSSSDSIGPPVAVGENPLSLAVLLGGIGLSMVGFVYAGRRFFGWHSWRSNGLLLVGGSVVGLVGVEAVTARSVFGDLALAAGTAVGGIGGGLAESAAGTVLLALGIALLLWVVHSNWLPLPRAVWLITAVGLGIWVLDAITGGALASGLSEVSALVWLLLIGGGIVLVWRALRPTTIEISGRSR